MGQQATSPLTDGTRPPRVSNRERTLLASLELFNERGAARVSTNTIATHIGISPGNLYYHFSNKEEIVRELWAQIQYLTEPALSHLSEGATFTPEMLAEFFGAAIDTIWRFRFFFRDIDELTARDPDFAIAYRSKMEYGRAALGQLCESLIKQGAMRAPGDTEDLNRLRTNLQLVMISWLPFVTTMRGSDKVGAGDVAEGVLHAVAIMKPFLDATYYEQVMHALADRAGLITEPQPDTPGRRSRSRNRKSKAKH